jgi:hypothetical protein
MKKINILLLAAGMFVSFAGVLFTGCTKQGEQGVAGTNGKDANETCKECHSPAVVDKIAVQFQLAKHSWGTVAFEEAGNTGCSPCHCQNAFVYVCQNNIPATFTFNSGTGKWVNNYATDNADAIGAITCFTCHSSLHTTYGYSDIQAFTTTAPVSMTMWGGAKTIDLQQDSAKSNLCVKCHEPRPLTCGNDPSGRLFPYDSILVVPNALMYDSTKGAKNIYAKPSYRMHVHYGAVGAVFAGKGGIEFPGPLAYGSSKHTTVAACPDCHMAIEQPMTGMAGGHSFNVRNAKESALGASTTWNFNGCNVTGCHIDEPMSATAAKWVNTRAADKALLDSLAANINAIGSGHNILHSDASASNLWWGVSSGNFDGYLDIYTPGTNDNGYWADPYLKNNTINNGKPKFPSLTMAQTGALINFQFCLREYSLGIHNTSYTAALMTNSIAILKAQASMRNNLAQNR